MSDYDKVLEAMKRAENALNEAADLLEEVKAEEVKAEAEQEDPEEAEMLHEVAAMSRADLTECLDKIEEHASAIRAALKDEDEEEEFVIPSDV